MLIAQYFHLLFLSSFFHFFFFKSHSLETCQVPVSITGRVQILIKKILATQEFPMWWVKYMMNFTVIQGGSDHSIERDTKKIILFLDAVNCMSFFSGFLFWGCSRWLDFSLGAVATQWRHVVWRVCWSVLHNDYWLYDALRWRVPLGSMYLDIFKATRMP